MLTATFSLQCFDFDMNNLMADFTPGLPWAAFIKGIKSAAESKPEFTVRLSPSTHKLPYSNTRQQC
jgi:hypothetical protein